MKSKSVKFTDTNVSYDCSRIWHGHWRYFNFKYQHYDFHGKQEL